MRKTSIKIVNMINENFSLKLHTVDSSQMTDDIRELLEKELPKPTKKAINKAIIKALEDILDDMRGVHPEYHKESVEDELTYLKGI